MLRVVRAGRKRGRCDHASASYGFGDFDISVLHRPGCHRLETSLVNVVCDSSIPTQRSARRADLRKIHGRDPIKGTRDENGEQLWPTSGDFRRSCNTKLVGVRDRFGLISDLM